jgi:hypothetical protein
MSLRRAGILALPLAIAACTDVTQKPQAELLVFATFASPNIPTPNDLALAALVSRSPLVNNCQTPVDACSLPPAQQSAQVQLLCAFRAAGGFPSDQEVPITIPLTAKRWDASAGDYGAYVPAQAPAADAASLRADTVTVVRVDGTAAAPLVFGTDFEVSTAAGAICTGTGATAVCPPGSITIRKRPDATGSRRWPAGARYAVAIRGGASGVTAAGLPVSADSAIALTIPNRDLSKKENQPLGAIPDSSAAGSCGFGSNADEIALLEAVRGALWYPLTWSQTSAGWTPAPSAAITPAYTAVDLTFPHAEAAAVATFGVAPSAGTVVLIDSGSGVAPLPIDLLRTDADGTVALNPAFGAAARGLDTLDGFSTTAMALAQTSGPINAGTVNGANVLLYRLTRNAAGAVTGATLVKELKRELGAYGTDPAADPTAAGYVAQPDAISPPCPAPLTGRCATAIGLQPATPAPTGTAFGTIYLPPLQEATSYAVVVTNRVKDVYGAGLARPTVAKILLDFTAPFTSGGASTIPGVGYATASALERMRTELEPVWAALPDGTTKAAVATAYTFRTQSIAPVALSLAGAPYSVEKGAGQAIFAVTGVAASAVPLTPFASGHFDITFNSIDAIDKTTGALRPTLAADLANPATLATLVKPLKAVVAVPQSANVPFCPGSTTTHCAKVVLIGHGLKSSRQTLYALSDALVAQGYVVVATDYPLHGARAWCASNADCGAGGTCTPFPGGEGQGDAVPPGTCTAGAPVDDISGQYYVSANFFRMRDANRQNILDQSALALAMARLPASAPYNWPQPAVDARAAMLPADVVIDPSAVRYLGASLGGIAGPSVLAPNPRFDRAVLNTGGGVFVDIALTSPGYRPQLDALFATLIPGYSPGAVDPTNPAFNPAVAAEFLKLVNVVKWILDPGEAVNFAGYVTAHPLPNLLADPTGATPMAAKDVFAQVAKDDAAVPNPTNYLLDTLLGAETVLYQGPGGTPIDHSFLGFTPSAQDDAANFLTTLAVPLSPVTLP